MARAAALSSPLADESGVMRSALESVCAAAQTLSKALRITPLSSASGEESAAARAIQELVACGLLPIGMDAEAPLTRGQAAELFLKALDLLEQRG